jgi:hypothetical protein
VSLNRYACKVDATQADIIDGLESAGIRVWVIKWPCDLLTYYPPLKRWRPLEAKPAPEPGIRVKTLAPRKRKDQERQTRFLNTYGVDVVRTAEEAIAAVLR